MKKKRVIVRSGIRTHAHRSGLRPERSALDHSAILTWLERAAELSLAVALSAESAAIVHALAARRR